MAIKVEIFKTYEINGKTFTGNFPIYASDAVCETETDEEQFVGEEDLTED